MKDLGPSQIYELVLLEIEEKSGNFNDLWERCRGNMLTNSSQLKRVLDILLKKNLVIQDKKGFYLLGPDAYNSKGLIASEISTSSNESSEKVRNRRFRIFEYFLGFSTIALGFWGVFQSNEKNKLETLNETLTISNDSLSTVVVNYSQKFDSIKSAMQMDTLDKGKVQNAHRASRRHHR